MGESHGPIIWPTPHPSQRKGIPGTIFLSISLYIYHNPPVIMRMAMTIDGNPRVACGEIPREAWLLTRLAGTLLGYLGTSTRW
jgi:hypothetical protein